MAITDPAPTSEIDRAAVFKQRRLLLSFTFALTAIHGLDVQLGNTISAQGLVLNFKHPIAIVVALWVSWAWALWRYWQYERAFSDHTLINQTHMLWEMHADLALRKHFNQRIKNGEFQSHEVLPSDEVAEIRTGTGAPARPKKGFTEDVWDFQNLVLLVPVKNKEKKTITNIEAKYTLDADQVVKIRGAVARQLIAKHPSIADFKVPYWLALLAPAAGLFALVRYYCFS